jgi:hypothetical protein
MAVAVTAAIATGGIGSGISGAMASAATATTTTTAAISATNASMNSNGDFFKQIKDISKTTWDDTTSKESLKNYAISGAIAAGTSWAISAANGSPDLKVGDYNNSKVGVNVVQENGIWYKEGFSPSNIGKHAKPASFFTSHVIGTENPFFKGMNATIPSVESGARGHDIWVDKMNFDAGMTAVTAPPYLLLNTCAAAPSLCGVYVNTKTDDNFLNQKPKN